MVIYTWVAFGEIIKARQGAEVTKVLFNQTFDHEIKSFYHCFIFVLTVSSGDM